MKHSRRSFLSRSAAAGALVFTESGIAQPSVAPVIDPNWFVPMRELNSGFSTSS